MKHFNNLVLEYGKLRRLNAYQIYFQVNSVVDINTGDEFFANQAWYGKF